MAPLLLVIDYWEKLAGASLALSATIRLCQRAGLSLVAPSVHSSLFLPSGGFPLSSYYDTAALGAALLPQKLESYAAWKRLRQGATGMPNASINVAVIYRDFPSACVDALSDRRTQCPPACLAASGVRRLIAASQRWLGHDRVPWHCVAAAEVRRTTQGGGGILSELLSRTSATALLNFRRHDGGKPMLPPTQGLALRATAVQPAPAIRAAARSFLAANAMPPTYALVQLRSNHLAHSAHVASGGAVAGSAQPPPQRNCTRRVGACLRRLSRATRRMAPPSATVVASDLSTLFDANQDGATHTRHPYMRDCLLPSLPALRRWRSTAGTSFRTNCTGLGAGGGARARRRRNASAVALACDAGYLGLVDLVLGSEADAFVAVDVKQPWRSAFLEWIVQARRLRGKTRTELISC